MSVMPVFREKWFLIKQRQARKKRIFFIYDQWLTVCDWQNGVFSDLERFQQGDKDAMAAFVAFLHQKPNTSPAYLLVDVIEEELRRELLPRLWGADRKQVLERRLERFFPGTPLRRAVSQGRDAKGSEWFLFSGLIKPDLVTPWLTALRQAGQPLAGIWSSQLLSRELLHYLPTRAENALLVGWHSGGLRQTFFHRGRTLLSRLTPMTGRTITELPELLRAEVEKSRWYLNSLRLLPTNSVMDLFILAQDELLTKLAEWPTNDQASRLHLVDATTIATRIGLRAGLSHSMSERLHGHLLLQHPQANHYAPQEALCYHTEQPHTTLPQPVSQPTEPQVLVMTNRPVRRLGDLLVEKKIITTDQLRTALTEQKRSGDPLGKVFITLGFVTEVRMRDLLAESLSQESIDLREVLPQPEVLQLVPKIFAQRHGVLPVLLKTEGRVLVVAMSNPLNVAVLDQLQAMLEAAQLPGMTVKPMLAGEGEISTAIDRFYGFELSVEGILHELETGEVDTASLLRETAEVGVAISHPMVRLVNALLVDAIKRHASDIHIGPTIGFVRIRYRIDGLLHLIYSLHRHMLSSLLVRIKVMAGMNIAESRLPQDGQISFFHAGRMVNFRVSSHPTLNGENLVLRVLDLREEMSSPKRLGLSKDALQNLMKLLERTMGLVLVTGPTGSGKTTTLYSILNHLNQGETNVMTLENPVEYPLPTVLQTHINREAGLDYATGIRSMLWQDPDVILVGEVHDKETAFMALQAAMTGHQVFTTLHAGTAIGAIPRLLNLGVERDALAGNISGIISQRLLRRLCLTCRQPKPATLSEQQMLHINPSAPIPTLYHPVGCANCLHTGYHGRFPIMEVLLLDEQFDELVHNGASREQLRLHTATQAFRPMAEDARSRVLAGETTLQEVSRVLDLVPLAD